MRAFVAVLAVQLLLAACSGDEGGSAPADAVGDASVDAAGDHEVAADVPADPADASADPGSDLAIDTASDVPADLPPEVPPGFPPGAPCTGHDQCSYGLCAETPDGLRCVRTCVADDCEPEYECVLNPREPGIGFVCVHRAPRECWPCLAPEDCRAEIAPAGVACAPIDGLWWCVRACHNSTDCDKNEDCVDDGRCTTGGACSCRVPEAIEPDRAGTCVVTKEDGGECFGEFRCTDGGAGPCVVPGGCT